LREVSITSFALLPSLWLLDGFPKSLFRQEKIASETSGSTGVDALLSKYIIDN